MNETLKLIKDIKNKRRTEYVDVTANLTLLEEFLKRHDKSNWYKRMPVDKREIQS